MSGVIVTGASGFIGLPLLERLASAGETVHALSTRTTPPRVRGVCWHQVDLSDHAAVDELVGTLTADRLIHLAWCTEHGRFWHTTENVLWIQRSLQLVRAFLRGGGCRLVVAGTCAEYDWSGIGGPLSESASRLEPATLYGAAKDALHRLARVYVEQEGVELAWGRLFFLYGPREGSERLVPSVIRSLLAGEPIATGTGEQVRDFMHVEDVAGALVALLDSPVVGAVNIASGVGVTVGEVLDQLVHLIGRPELVRRGGSLARDAGPPLLLADVARLRDEVGFRPSWTLSAGLAASVQWWQHHQDWPDG
ncbi:MAG: NAD-dependent epimerase/dehydratase [Solirubrobacterales bacterium]|nr:NAD-dependent epimerase/dehydratase [Solirubrobacterales bacterium]